MAAQLISYDLRKPGRDYSELYTAIKSIGTTWWHGLESVWVVQTSLSSAQVRDRINLHVDANDKVLVTSLNAGWATLGLNTECNNWLRENL